MTTITVISDTHGNRKALEKMDGIFAESDMIIHLGDTSGDGNIIKNKYPDKTYLLNGNCDFMKIGQDKLVLQVEGVKIFACHGDAYGVKTMLSRLAYAAEEEGCNVALYGHTHIPREDVMGNVTLFNPGTLSRYSQQTYLYLVIHGDKAVGKIVELHD
jgi:putative phosphoesterase